MLKVFLCFLSSIAMAYDISQVKVSGEKQADILFHTSPDNHSVPSYKINENVIELTFPGAELAESLQGKLDLDSPHVLVHRISTYAPEKKVVRSRVILNGSVENLKHRLNLSKVPEGIRLSVDFPKGDNPTLNLLKEEQQPIASVFSESKAQAPKFAYGQTLFLVFALILLAVAGGFILRFLKTKGKWQGTRKYLIEQVSYYPLAGKSGVSLLKIGNEFVLVGVTPNQVTLLSALPKLQDQYESESRFERGAFKEAVEEEFERIKSARGIA